MEKLGKYLQGYVKIRLESSMPERFLSLCVHNQIPLWNLKNKDLYYEMEISVRNYFRLNAFRRKTQSKILLLEKHGLPFFFQKNKKRKAFFLGFFLGVLLLYVCSLFIWDIQIHGNHFYSQETVLETLEAFQIRDGTLKKNVDCQKIAAKIRTSFPQVVWVSAKIQGTCLMIEMKENEDSYTDAPAPSETKGYDLTAEKDGTIVKMVTRKGMPLVQEGETCKAGDLLVSGRLEILDNDAQVQRYEYVRADADIEILTDYAYYDEFSLQHTVKIYNKKEKRYGMLRLFGKEFSLWRDDASQAEIYRTEHPVFLTPSFCLPLSYGSIRVVPYETKTKIRTPKEARELAAAHLQVYLENLVKQGAIIKEQKVQVQIGKEKCITKGSITVVEKTGKPVSTEKIPLPEPEKLQ